MAIKQVFKQYIIIQDYIASQLGNEITEMLSSGLGWQMYGPTMVGNNEDGGEFFYQAMMLYEFINEPEIGE